MSNYLDKQHIFYDVSSLDIKQKISILNNAKENATKWWVDKLDCSESWSRQKINMSFEDILKKFKKAKRHHFVVIQRFRLTTFGEIGFSLKEDVEYFLWIYVSLHDFEKLIKKYNLKKL